MKKLLLATLMLSACACYANVSKGRGDTYCVDQWGSEFTTEQPKDRFRKVKMMPEAEARHSDAFKSSSPIALF